MHLADWLDEYNKHLGQNVSHLRLKNKQERCNKSGPLFFPLSHFAVMFTEPEKEKSSENSLHLPMTLNLCVNKMADKYTVALDFTSVYMEKQ